MDAPEPGARFRVADPAFDGYLVEGVVDVYLADDTDAAVATARQRQDVFVWVSRAKLEVGYYPGVVV